MTRKGLMKGIPTNIPDLEEPCIICLLNEATKITSGSNMDISKSPPGFMLQMDFSFYNVEIIHGFTSTFVAVCSATSYPFGFTSRSKRPSLDITKLLVTTSSNQDKKVAFVRVEKYGALARPSGFMITCHNMNIIFQTKGGDSYSLNG